MISGIPAELEQILAHGLFEQVPFNVAVIDREFRVVAANHNFREFFGNWEGRRCYEVYKGLTQPCAECQAIAVFEDGLVRVSDETGLDRHGRSCHYVVHLAPLRDASGEIRYVLEMTTDLTETLHWQRQYDLFFERVPCLVAVLDRNFRIVRTNEKFRDTFGEAVGRYCYETYKRRPKPCRQCPARMSLQDGREHTATQVGVDKEGNRTHYVVTTTPLSRGKGPTEHIIEMALDITPIRKLESQLRRVHSLYRKVIETACIAVMVYDTSGRCRIFNPAASQLFRWSGKQPPSWRRLLPLLPDALTSFGQQGDAPLRLEEAAIRNTDGESIPVRISVTPLRSGSHKLGWALLLEDLRTLKQLEKEKLEAERLAAVGETVAGLAHTIKNVLMGLEGGMYMMDTGLRQAKAERLLRGFEVLQRNFDKITTLVKDFLAFAKGRLPEFEWTDPNEVASAVVNLYADKARQHGVELKFEPGPVRPAPLDRRGIETCLTNLISNAIDAVLMSDRPGGVYVRTRQAGDELIFEVVDEGCGMDAEIKSKIFTTFFTTKGGKGTGLGLLTTRKIVQEHGGAIEVESVPGEGSTFRIRLSYRRLQSLLAAAEGVRQVSQGGTD